MRNKKKKGGRKAGKEEKKKVPSFIAQCAELIVRGRNERVNLHNVKKSEGYRGEAKASIRRTRFSFIGTTDYAGMRFAVKCPVIFHCLAGDICTVDV